MSPPEFCVVLRSSTPTLPPRELVFEHTHKVMVYLLGLIPTPNGFIAKVQSSDGSVVSFRKAAVAVLASVVVFLKIAVAVLMRLCCN